MSIGIVPDKLIFSDEIGPGDIPAEFKKEEE